jgi:hypothetical protein
LDVGRSTLTLTFAQDRMVDTERLVQLVNSKPDSFKFLSQSKLKVNMAFLSLPEDLRDVEKAIKSFDLH